MDNFWTSDTWYYGCVIIFWLGIAYSANKAWKFRDTGNAIMALILGICISLIISLTWPVTLWIVLFALLHEITH